MRRGGLSMARGADEGGRSAGPQYGDLVSCPQSRLSRHQRQRTVQASRQQHAVKGIAVAPVEPAGRFGVGGIHVEFDESGVGGRRSRRAVVYELSIAPFNGDLPERGRADIDGLIGAQNESARPLRRREWPPIMPLPPPFFDASTALLAVELEVFAVTPMVWVAAHVVLMTALETIKRHSRTPDMRSPEGEFLYTHPHIVVTYGARPPAPSPAGGRGRLVPLAALPSYRLREVSQSTLRRPPPAASTQR